ncbi:MAG: sugar phosphate isomerase/epimerase family protein [Candidatus Margulisiibacteriota bacterium]
MLSTVIAAKPRVALCTEGFHPRFNKMAAVRPNLEIFQRAAATAAQLGYRGIEIVATTLADEPTKLTVSQISQFTKAAEQAGVEIVGLHWLLAGINDVHLTSPDPFTRENTCETIADLLRLTKDLGGRLVVHGSPNQRSLLPNVTPKAALDYAVGIYTDVMDETEDTGIKVCFEQLSHEETDFITTLPELANFISWVGNPRFTGHLDVKALNPQAANEKEAAALIRNFAFLAGHFHLNDWTNKSGPGCGTLHMPTIFKAIGDSGYYSSGSGKWLSVEFFDFIGDGIPEESVVDIARRSYQCIIENRELWKG